MTTQQKLQIVSERIRKDIPRLMEPTEGCLLTHPLYKFKYKICFIKEDTIFCQNLSSGGSNLFNIEELDILKIIGHEIMLNDVLEWLKIEIDNREFIYSINSKGVFNTSSGINDVYVVEDIIWNLSSPYLKDQSEELINFLYELQK